MRKGKLVLAAVALAFTLAGCDAEVRQFVIDLALAWAKEHAVEIGAYTFTGSSGNDEVDAVMEAREVINNIKEADQLMEEGRRTGDLDKMEEAIEKRPGDYTYRVSYGAALLKNGDASEAEAQFAAADEAVADYSGDHAQAYAIQGIDELGALGPDFEQNGFDSAQQCRAYYGRMAYFYEIRAVTGEAYFEQQHAHYQALSAGCQ